MLLQATHIIIAVETTARGSSSNCGICSHVQCECCRYLVSAPLKCRIVISLPSHIHPNATVASVSDINRDRNQHLYTTTDTAPPTAALRTVKPVRSYCRSSDCSSDLLPHVIITHRNKPPRHGTNRLNDG